MPVQESFRPKDALNQAPSLRQPGRLVQSRVGSVRMEPEGDN